MEQDSRKTDSMERRTNVRRNEESAKPKTVRVTRMAGDASGINVADRRPIDPRMPSLPPA